MKLLPEPAANGFYYYPDGCKIWKRGVGNRASWKACWADGTMLMGDNDEISWFWDAEDAAKALLSGGEGPTSLRKS